MRKKILALCVVFAAVTGVAKAQKQYTYQPFRIDAGPFVMATFTGIGVGAGIGIEPKFNLYKNLSLGVRFDIFAGSQRMDEESISLEGKNLFVTADWHLNNAFYRPFFGVGAGIMTTAYEYSSGSSYSDMPMVLLRTGFDIPHLRVGVQASVTGSHKAANQTFNFSTIGVFVNVGIGGGRKPDESND